MKNKYSRREALGWGLGAAVMGAYGHAVSAAETERKPNQQEVSQMTTLSEFHQYGEELEKQLMLRTSPIAVKMLEKDC